MAPRAESLIGYTWKSRSIEVDNLGLNEMDRREFLTLGMEGGVMLSLAGVGVVPWRLPRALGGTTVNVNLTAEAYAKMLVDGASVTAWRFVDGTGGGPGALSAGLRVLEGDTLNVTVTNDLDRAINFEIPGVLTGTPSVAPTGSQLYSFPAPPAGSYLFTDGVNGEIGRAMGLAGPLVVMPGDGSNRLYPGGPAFDLEYTLVLQDHDDRLNAAVAAGGGYDMADYEPNYFFLNGLSFPDCPVDPETRIAMSLGDEVAIRFVNAGAVTSPMHFHGYHCQVATRNRVPETVVVDKDTVLVGLGECVDVLVAPDKTGLFPLHTHFVPGTTANGVYVNPYGGALTLLETT